MNNPLTMSFALTQILSGIMWAAACVVLFFKLEEERGWDAILYMWMGIIFGVISALLFYQAWLII